MHPSWNHLQSLIPKIDNPHPKNPLRVFDMARSDVRVVFLGQDPYPSNLATGLAFGVPDWCSAWPPSLKNIQKELLADTGEILADGTLENWEKQGVLLLNMILTVDDQHRGWQEVSGAALASCNDVVVIALGSNARRFAYKYKPINSIVISAAHPSSLSANKGFFGSRIFSRCNQFVKGEPIKWGKR